MNYNYIFRMHITIVKCLTFAKSQEIDKIKSNVRSQSIFLPDIFQFFQVIAFLLQFMLEIK